MSFTGPEFISSINKLQIPAGAMGFWWIGQGSAVIKIGGQIVWLDPYLDPELGAKPGTRRMMEPPVAPEEVTNATVILLTHDHRDHIDPASLPGIAEASPEARVIAPNPHLKRINDLIGQSKRNTFVKAGDTVKISGLEITAIPAAHERLDEDSALGHPYLGYILKADGLTMYCAGDTVPYEGLVEELTGIGVDIAMLPINGRDFFRTRSGTIGNMDYREAAEVAHLCRFDTLIPVHWGMFAGNTVPPGQVVTYAAYREYDFHIHVPGLARPWLYRAPR
jgi:L-ascorbate metabolism protein UlaG (beta-lactamase superfamily)